MKDVAYYFTSNNVRSTCDPEMINCLKGLPNVVVNPDLSSVKGVKREFWKIENGKIVPMDEFERDAIRAHHDKHGVDNEIRLGVPIRKRPRPIHPTLRFCLEMLAAAAVGASTVLIFSHFMKG